MARVAIAPAYERQLYNDLSARRRTFDEIYQQAMQPGFGEAFAAQAQRYPYARPGVLYGLTASGIPAGDPIADQLAEMSLQQSIAEDPTFALPDGAKVHGTARTKPASQGEGPAGFAWDGIKSLSRGTFMGLSAPVQEIASIVTSAGEAAMDDDSGFFGDFWHNLKNEAPRSELWYATGELFDRVQSGEIDFTDPASLRENFWSGDPELIGSGFLPAGDIAAERERRTQNLQLNGQFLTPGRVYVEATDRTELIERGSRTYNWISGLADAAFQLGADPTTYLPVAGQVAKGARIRNAASVLDNATSGAVPLVQQVGTAAGQVNPQTFAQRWRSLLMRTPVRTVDQQGAVWEFSSGSRDLDWLLGGLTQERNAHRIARAFNGQLDREMAVAIADTDNPQQIAGMLRTAVMGDAQAGVGPTVAALPQLTRRQRAAALKARGTDAPVFRRPTDRFTWAAVVPNAETSVLDASDRVQAADRFANWIRAADSSLSESSDTIGFAEEWADRIMRIEDGPTAASELSDVVADAMRRFGARTNTMTPEVSNLITRDATYAHEARSYFARRSIEEIERPGMKFQWVNTDGSVGRHTLQEGESVGAIVQGDVQVIPSPVRISELAHSGVSLPDWRDVRRATNRLGHLEAIKAGYGINDVARSFTKGVWLSAVLLRPAVTTRILLDSQLRAAFDGAPSAFRNPMEWVSTMIGRKGVPRFDRDIMGREWKDVDHFAEAMEGLSFAGFTDSSMIRGPLSRDFGVMVERARNPEAFLDSATRHLIRVANDPVSRMLAERGPDATVNWLTQSQAGRSIVDMMNTQVFDGAIRTRNGVREWVDTLASDMQYVTGGNTAMLADLARGRIAGIRVAADYDSTLGRVVPNGERPDADYFDAVRQALTNRADLTDTMPQSILGSRAVTGPVTGVDRVKQRAGQLSDWLFDALMTKPENAAGRSPVFRSTYYRVLGDLLPRATREEAMELIARARKFGNVPDGPSNAAFRAFRADGRKTLKQWEEIANKLPSGGAVDPDRIEAFARLAGQEASRESLDLLYDLTERKLWEDAFSVGAPFISVWADTLKTYFHPTRGLITTNPTMLRRSMQTLRSARAADPDNDGRSFIHEDQNGVEQFVIPNWAVATAMGAIGGAAGATLGAAAGATAATAGARFAPAAMQAGATQTAGGVARAVGQGVGRMAGSRAGLAAQRAVGTTARQQATRGAAALGAAAGVGSALDTFNTATDVGPGANVEYVAQAAGLNIVAATVLPGAGPVVQIPLAHMVENTPQLDWVWNQIFPYGRPRVEAGVLESMFPAWMQRFATVIRDDPNSVRTFGNTVADMTTALQASGTYDADGNGLLDEGERERLILDATEKAKALFIVRGLAQTTLPTGPQVEFTAETQYGEIGFQALSQEYRDIRDEYGSDVAMGEFIARYGTDLLGVTIPKTRTIRARSFNPEGADWERQNNDLVTEFTNTIEFFAPDDGTDDFDFAAYNRAIARGDLASLTPDDRLRLLNNAIGSAYLRSQRNMMGDAARSDDGKIYLRELKADLIREYPGFSATDNLPASINTEAAIGELERASVSEDSRIADLPVTSAIREYLGLREQATQAALAINGSTFQQSSADEIVALRDALRQEAARIMRDTPEFAEVWRLVFERELRDDVGTQDAGPQPFDRWLGPAPLRQMVTR